MAGSSSTMEQADAKHCPPLQKWLGHAREHARAHVLVMRMVMALVSRMMMSMTMNNHSTTAPQGPHTNHDQQHSVSAQSIREQIDID